MVLAIELERMRNLSTRQAITLFVAVLAALVLFGCRGGGSEATPSASPRPGSPAAGSPTLSGPTPTPDPNATPTPTPWPTDTPVPVRRWVRLAIGEGIITAVAVDPASGNTVYAGSNSGTLYRSADGGRTWEQAGPQGLHHPVSAVNLPAKGSGSIFLGTRGGGAMRFSGAAWSPVAGLPGAQVHFILRDSRSDSTLFAGTDAGGFRSEDQGEHWSPLDLKATPPDVLSMAQHPTDPLILYAGTTAGVQKSTDGGRTWLPAGTGLDSGNVISLAVDPAENDTIWAGTETGSLYKTTDAGRFWRKAGAGINGNRVPALVVDTREPAVFAGTGTGVYKSENSLSWDPIGMDLTNRNVTALSIASNGERRLYAATFGGGLFRLSLG